MGPKPTITYHDDRELLNAAMLKRLQNRLKQLQLSSSKDRPNNAFSTFCDGFKIIPFSSHQRNRSQQCFLEKPLVHTFWNATLDLEEYRVRTKPQITQWIDDVKSLGDYAECLVVFCVTAEVRAAKKKVKGQGDVEEKLRNDFKGTTIVTFRLASSHESRLAESFNLFTNVLNEMCFTCMNKLILEDAKYISAQKLGEIPLQEVYSHFVRLINLAVAYEMTLQDSCALEFYNEASYVLEITLDKVSKSNSSINWLDTIASNPCTAWDYPNLTESEASWKYLPAVQGGSSPLLHIRTFLFSRQARLLFALDKGWSVSQTCMSTLHAMSREKRDLKVLQSMQAGAVESWAYMTCFEAIQAIMTQSNPDSLMSASSSFLHVRAELWHYALEKLRTIGSMCGLMPKDSCNLGLIKAIQSGITKRSAPVENKGLEDHGHKLTTLLKSQQEFKKSYLTLGEMVIGAYKHAGRKRMAFRVGSMMAEFQKDLGLWVEAEQLLSDVCSYFSDDQWSHLFIKPYSLLAECQNKLKFEDKYVGTMVLLTSVPRLKSINHDPVVWMDKIMQISKKSAYQKILNWEPLIALKKITVINNRTVYSDSDQITIEVDLIYNGPKEMNLTIATMTFSAINQVLPSSPSKTAKLELQELNLDANADSLSRPIGAPNKRYRSLDSSTGRSGEPKQRVFEFLLTNRQLMLLPGHNKIVLLGKATVLGQYISTKIGLKSGSLDFILPLTEDDTIMLSIEPCKPSISVSLSSDIGVFVAGYTMNCALNFQTGSSSTIPLKSKVNVIFTGNCEVKVPGAETCAASNHSGQLEVMLELPEVLSSSSVSIPLTIFIPATSVSTKASDPLHEVHVYCTWLKPAHVVKIPVHLEQPFDIQVSECAGGDYTYFLLNVTSTCSVPLELDSFSITSRMALVCLHNHLSAVLHPNTSVSNIWQCCADEISSPVPANCSFNFKPIVQERKMPPCTVNHQVTLSSMQIEYHLSMQASPENENSSCVANNTLLLKYDIKGILSKPRSDTLQYKVVADKTMWKIVDNEIGTTSAPNSEQITSVTIKAMPKISGFLSVPNIILSYGLPPIELTGAQVYNLSHCDVIKID